MTSTPPPHQRRHFAIGVKMQQIGFALVLHGIGAAESVPQGGDDARLPRRQLLQHRFGNLRVGTTQRR
jgi:hypothetical protein